MATASNNRKLLAENENLFLATARFKLFAERSEVMKRVFVTSRKYSYFSMDVVFFRGSSPPAPFEKGPAGRAPSEMFVE